MKSLVIIIVIVLLALAAYFVLRKSPQPQPQVNPVTGGGTSAPLESINPGSSSSVQTAPQSASVSISNFAFNPQTLTVKSGTTVTWTNNDSVPHTVTSDSGNTLNSRTIAPGQSFSFTFGSAGTYSYHCTIHPMMKGKVVVTQ